MTRSKSPFDLFGERITRNLARLSSRWSVMGATAAGQIAPILPVARAAETPLTEFELKTQR